ncbi:hypothetical protein FOPG_17703 [Fusarium oxysporum f. sp. conglutinans race 2 54008]|uniref:Enoyl reductase (ER) domain-containing protein n=1 Tax=Fusarium oxysporum f. sp. conglutinans race 2 54008 TaxID=1089457 RepID=X0GR45_FUSOX|nr:hypothetical protein FOPG_17703 [Fusarium oxysporum f. sp. conglutinans race 2 54008]
MFALRYASTKGGFEANLTLEENVDKLVMPSDGPAAVVEVLYSSLNPEDYKLPELPFLGSWNIPPPATPGTDYVGRTYETNMPDLKKGDMVFGTLDLPTKYGTLAQYVLVKGKDGVSKVPRGFEDAGIDMRDLVCLVTAGLTALQSLKPQPVGAHVFINGGSGGTGTFCIQIAKRINGAAKIVTSCSGKNVPLVKNLGANNVIDYAQGDVVEKVEALTKDAGRKFDLIVDNVGNNPDLYWQSQKFLGVDGHFIRIGAPSVDLRVRFSALFVETNSEQLETLGKWVMVMERKLEPVMGGSFRLGDASQAFAMLKSLKA